MGGLKQFTTSTTEDKNLKAYYCNFLEVLAILKSFTEVVYSVAYLHQAKLQVVSVQAAYIVKELVLVKILVPYRPLEPDQEDKGLSDKLTIIATAMD